MTEPAQDGWIGTTSGRTILYLDDKKVEEVDFAISWREENGRTSGRGWMEAFVDTLHEARTRRAELDWDGSRVAISVSGPHPGRVRAPWADDGERWSITARPPPAGLGEVLTAPKAR